ncbi:MFS transporter [Microlunatus sp. GCM10028923]|uniref:MFS transporter n=1 Tax=Microlunatus sp. GCM10028923 TaxID=3273400 RepID=UPI003610E77C
MSLSSPRRAEVRMPPRARAVVFVLSGAIFLEGIDLSMMGVALPSIRADLGLSTPELQWVMSAFVLGYAGFVLLGGRAADLLGRRRMFLLWLTVFLVASGLGGMAGEGWMLIAARFVTGVAAAFMTPAGLSIITTMFEEGERRNKALLVYAGMAAAGFSLGMMVGGALAAMHWRWVFFAPVIAALLLLITAVRVLPAGPTEERRPRLRDLDLAGAVTLTGAMLILVLALVRVHEVPVAESLITFGAAALLGIVFVIIERRVAAPLIRFGILRSASVVRANLAAVLVLGGFNAYQFILVLYLQELRDWTPLQTGLALVVLGFDAVLAPTLTPRLVARFGNVRVIATGLALAALGYALFLPLDLDRSYLTMLPAMVIIAVSFALVYGPTTILATDGVAESEQGLAGGLVNTSFQFGAALGIAAASVIITAVAGGTHDPQQQLAGYRSALLVPPVAAALGVLIVGSALLRRRAQPPLTVPATQESAASTAPREPAS